MKQLLAILAALFFAASAFAGKSLEIGTANYARNVSVPSASQSANFRDEFCIHGWPASPASGAVALIAGHHAVHAVYFPDGAGGFVLQVYTNWDSGVSGTSPFNVSLNGLADKYLCFRMQRDVTGALGTAQAVYLEAWNSVGVRVYSASYTYTSTLSTETGVQFGSASNDKGYIAFYRSHSALVALNSRPPTTLDNTNRTYEWKFDQSNSTGTLAEDTNSNTYPLSIVGSGSATYLDTPFQDTFATLKTLNAPTWTNTCPLRVGNANQFDGSQSYSMSDSSNTVTYAWSQLAGPTTLAFDNTTLAQPTVTNVGSTTTTPGTDYHIQLVATGADMSTATVSAHIGGVAFDDNGVVIPGNSNVTAFYGPMITVCHNPWGWMDERAVTGDRLQSENNYLENTTQVWDVKGAGTVSYYMLGIGPNGGETGTTLTGNISASDTSLGIADARKIPGLLSLPTWILVGNAVGGQEIIAITACTSVATGMACNAGTVAATLTVGYDGRGVSAGLWSNINPPAVVWTAAVGHNSGDTVGEFRMVGSGTQFKSDATSALAPIGLPGPMGTAHYSTGQVTLTAGSAVIAGTSTAWINAIGPVGSAQDYYVMYIEATHGGTPFHWWAQLVSVASDTSSTWSRPLPTGTDAGPFNYTILRQSAPVLNFTDGTSTHNGIFESAGCVSETICFAGATYDFFGFPGSHTQTGRAYSYDDNSAASRGIAGAFGPNFYCTGCGHRALFYRSGVTSAWTHANLIDNQWIRHPRLGGGYTYDLQLTTGGGVLGAIQNIVLNPSAAASWQDARYFAARAAVRTAHGCDESDTRDRAYNVGVLLAHARWDTAMSATWHPAAEDQYDQLEGCRDRGITGLPVEVNSWANSYLRNDTQVVQSNGSTPVALTLTNGSANFTGSNLSGGSATAFCDGLDVLTNSITVTAGSASISTSATFDASANAIVIGGKMYAFFRTNSTTGTISALWPGSSSSSQSGMTRNVNLSTFANFSVSFGSGADPANRRYNHACKLSSSSAGVLDSPWEGTTGSTYHPYVNNVSGFNQQPYMISILSSMIGLGSALDVTLGTNFTALRNYSGAWAGTYGLDYQGGDTSKATLGTIYGRVCSWCEAGGLPAGTRDWTIPGLLYGLNTPDAQSQAREINAELFPALVSDYMQDPTPEKRTRNDIAFGALWGHSSLTTGGVYSDSNSLGNVNGHYNLGDCTAGNCMGGYRQYGYNFGVGEAHQWPAVRNCVIVNGACQVVVVTTTTSPRISGSSRKSGSSR